MAETTELLEGVAACRELRPGYERVLTPAAIAFLQVRPRHAVAFAG